MAFAPEHCVEQILRLAPRAHTYWVAFSGGLDSTVLLQLLVAGRARLPAPLGAVHVNHNLQPQASDWATHCARFCAARDLKFHLLSVDARAATGASPEAVARQARYRAFSEWLPADAVLITAHHQDDQAETLLLQLLRGSGPKGLAGMPAQSGLGRGRLLRPLLATTRAELDDYARAQGLTWIDDPSNTEPAFDRNYLRHQVWPGLRARWPAVTAVLARAAAHQAEAALLLDDLAHLDLQSLSDLEADLAGLATLPVERLLGLSGARRANLLRYWLHAQGAPVPSQAVLTRLEADVLRAVTDAVPLLRWADVGVRRYRGRLYLTRVETEPDPTLCLDWDGAQPLSVAGGTLSASPVTGAGIAKTLLESASVQVRLRRGGERLRPAGRREHHSLKHLFQDAGVPPWERARVPLIYRDETLIAVAGYWVCEGFQAGLQEPGVQFKWSRAIVPGGSFW